MITLRNLTLVSFCLGTLFGTAMAQPITASEIETHLRVLADPKTQGRGLGTEGLEIASHYIEEQFQTLGLEPAFDDSYLQPFTLVGSTPDPKAQLFFGKGASVISPTYLREFMVFTSQQGGPAQVKGEVVYAGYLIQAPERNWDDIKGVDLKGKVLLVEVNEPGNIPGGLFEGPEMTYYGRWTYKYEQAARLGAAGVLLIHNRDRATYGWDVVRNSWALEAFTIKGQDPGSPFEGWVTEPIAQQMIQFAGRSHSELLSLAEGRDFTPVPLGIEVTVKQNPTFREVTTTNVGAVLQAKGGRKNAPYVVVSAHHDHLGLAPDGSPYSGVVDNGSAVSTLLSLARYFHDREPLDINLLFLAVSAEEQGLMGSRYFVENLPVPSEKVWADLNLEMTNIWGPTQEAYAIGARLSTLDAVAREAAAEVGLTYIEERDRENGFFFRSDQFSFARAGIPGLWPQEGPTSLGDDPNKADRARKRFRAEQYHKTTDSLAVHEKDWDLEGTVQIANWVAAMVDNLAQKDEPPEFLPQGAFQR